MNTNISYNNLFSDNPEYKKLEQEINQGDFKGNGITKACELSDKIAELRKMVFEGRLSNDRTSIDLNLYPQLNTLDQKLIEKVAKDQKNTLLVPLSLFIKNETKSNSLKQEYQKVHNERLELPLITLGPSLKPFLSLTRPFFDKKSLDYKQNELKQKLNALEVELRKLDVNDRLIAPVMEAICEYTKNEQQSQGFFYRVTNKVGVQSYLVGTVHKATKGMCQTPGLDYVIKNSDQLYIENVPAVWLHKFNKLNFTNPYNDSIDLTLYNKAVDKGIPVDSLETMGDEINALTHGVPAKDIAYAIASNAKNSLVKDTREFVNGTSGDNQPDHIKALKAIFYPTIRILQKEYELLHDIVNPKKASLHEKVQEIAMINLWQSGNLSFLEQLPNDEYIFDKRNQNWLNDTKVHEGMASKLMNAKAPICFAVGCGHLAIGNSNILDTLKKTNDLMIERGYYNYETTQMEWE